MATTRIMSLHVNKGKTASQCIKERLDYIMNPEKTDGGMLVSSYACVPETAANEFMLYRHAYLENTSRDIPNEIIAYHVRQAFKPGEVTPEEANKIGIELASKMTNDENAFVVATHTDKHHIHNHIMICSISLNCTYKYRDVKRSSKDLVQLSDEICRQHGLSVVQNPQDKTVSYDKWLGNKKPLTGRDFLRMAIDTALQFQPDGFDALMQMMGDVGCVIKRGVHISIKPPDGQRFIRLDSLGTEYSEASLRKALAGDHVHVPKIPRSEYSESQVKRLVNIEAKLKEGKGKGYMVWAERNNIDAKAQSVIFLKENHIGSISELEDRIRELRDARNTLNTDIRDRSNRMKEINQLRQAIRDYSRTKGVYTQYRESSWSSQFYHAHRQAIEAHKKAQAVYSTVGGTIPTLKELTAEYDALKEQNKTDKASAAELKPELTTLAHIRYNYDVLVRDFPTDTKELLHEEQKNR